MGASVRLRLLDTRVPIFPAAPTTATLIEGSSSTVLPYRGLSCLLLVIGDSFVTVRRGVAGRCGRGRGRRRTGGRGAAGGGPLEGGSSGRGIGGRTGGWAEGSVARGGWAAGWRPVREMSARGRRQVLGAPGPQGGQGAIGPRSFGRDGGLEVSLPGQPVLHDGAGAGAVVPGGGAGRGGAPAGAGRSGAVDRAELVVEVEQALAERGAGVGEADPALLTGEGEVLHVQVDGVARAGLDDLLRVLEGRDAVGRVQADADEG